MLPPHRYITFLNLVNLCSPKTVCEVGTWNGFRAIEIGNLGHKMDYIGYDLFEDATSVTDKEEFNVKPHHTQESVKQTIKSLTKNDKFTFKLVKGNTRKTLKPTKVDLAFIDGGHSIETIRGDYAMLKDSSVVVLDDYYIGGGGLDIERFGCNNVISNNKFYLFPDKDPVIGGGKVTMAVMFNDVELEELCKPILL